MLSVGGIRHQFTLPENVQMSMFTTEFLRNIRENLKDDDDPPDVQFNHQGYLFLVPPNKAEDLSECVKMQRELGLEGEGWFDPWLLLRALRKKNLNMGVNYVNGEVTGFESSKERIGEDFHDYLKSVNFKDADGNIRQISFVACVNCAGPWAGEISKMVQPTTEEKFFLCSRKRFVYVVHCPEGPPISAPLTVDPTGTYFRREGFSGHYLCGASPEIDNEPDTSNLDVDYDFFNNKVWPDLSNRIPAFEKLKLKSAWAGYYDFNYVDQNLIIGKHPYHTNFFFANGMSGHGVQQSIAIGRAVMELIVDSGYKTIDLSRFGFERFIIDQPLFERAIV
ncbi:hypothetical protein KUTeg_022473 [Tegillarca granosa]|uniref:FAD-dependent oxidoreductase domain-containing protein 1 n=1 Tax=Tegillarca granosa TaxID=220873 RepID=A0ABQ9E6I3_TEGGR|nr:hypothetical protein KUTeg_022473 [Tegillarca granosa]